jgi:hypothetical protein
MTRRMLVPVVCLVAMTLLSSAGCVRQQRFRFVPARTACFPETARAEQTAAPADQKPSLDCRREQYKLAFIEFDQQGRAWDRQQGEVALKLLDAEKARVANGKVITVVYVHGWKNNASEAPPGGKPKDVEKFRSALAELGFRSQQAAGSGPPIPVVGVYMAWRGKSLMGPSWFNFLSVWGRRNSANRVGEHDPFPSSLTKVIDKVNEPADGIDTGSRIVMVGHSFGARVLEHAIEMKSVQLYKPIEGQPSVQPTVDLTLYVNSANDARLTMGRVQKLRAQPIVVRHPDYRPEDCVAPGAADTPKCRDYPLLVAITSRGDTATKYLLPTINTLNLDKSAPTPPPPVGTFLDRTPSSGVYRRSAAGHTKFLQSHVVREVACPSGPRPRPPAELEQSEQERVQAMVRVAVAEALGKTEELKAELAKEAALKAAAEQQAEAETRRAMDAMLRPTCPAGDSQCRFIFRTQNEHPACFQVDQRAPAGASPAGVTAAPLPFNTTAFWIMDVDQVVIKDHGDIWNLSFVEMLAQLMAPRGFFEPAKGRVQVRAAPR